MTFSEVYKNINKATFTTNDQLYKTHAIVCGDGEGTARTVAEATIDEQATGWNRRELMVDARDISRTDMTTQQYTAALIQRGTEKLAECGIVECLEAATLPFVNFSYKKDYDLGDIVTVRKKAWGIEMDKRITEIQEIYENGGMSSFCVDISDVTLRQIFKVENLSYCNLHRTRPTDENSELPSYSTARAMRQLCRETGSCVRKINPPTPSGTVELMVGRTTSDGSYTVLVTTSLMHVSEAGEVMSTVLPLAAALIFAFSMSAAWLFSEWFTKPLRQLSGAARQVAQGDYAVQVETNRRDELGDLAQEFNHMAKEVQHAAQMQRDLLANVSHDLRTPLTLIKGYAETVRDITGDDKSHRDEQMNIIVDEADRLTALVSSVMELSKVTSGAEKCEKVHFDMGQLCDEVSERYDAVCAQNGWQLKLELPEEELPVYADPNMMQRALHNLLGNAMHHIGGDGIFLLRASKVPEGVRVEIEDHGPGICAEDLPYIFDRYYRSRSDAGKQGTGLGLSITKAIFQQHGFRFGVQSTLGKGTTFWFIATDTK